ncbi:hypothetical protein OG21DRAFT_777312 [Imleria badia]|nr:hypothetical protein OG21DRAFT_777312 [Imleria badia]
MVDMVPGYNRITRNRHTSSQRYERFSLFALVNFSELNGQRGYDRCVANGSPPFSRGCMSYTPRSMGVARALGRCIGSVSHFRRCTASTSSSLASSLHGSIPARFSSVHTFHTKSLPLSRIPIATVPPPTAADILMFNCRTLDGLSFAALILPQHLPGVHEGVRYFMTDGFRSKTGLVTQFVCTDSHPCLESISARN